MKKISETKDFEKLLTTLPPDAEYTLRLYITGMTTRSTQALSNIKAICEDQLAGHYQLEVIDIYQHPEQAKEGQIIAAPTLVKTFPLPIKRLVGDLSDKQRVLAGLGLSA